MRLEFPIIENGDSGMTAAIYITISFEPFSGGVPRENHRPATSHRQTLSYNIIMSTPCLSEVRTPRNNHMFTIDA
jgi:hypothetical protein